MTEQEWKIFWQLKRKEVWDMLRPKLKWLIPLVIILIGVGIFTKLTGMSPLWFSDCKPMPFILLCIFNLVMLSAAIIVILTVILGLSSPVLTSCSLEDRDLSVRVLGTITAVIIMIISQFLGYYIIVKSDNIPNMIMRLAASGSIACALQFAALLLIGIIVVIKEKVVEFKEWIQDNVRRAKRLAQGWEKQTEVPLTPGLKKPMSKKEFKLWLKDR